MSMNVIIYVEFRMLDQQCGGRDYKGETTCKSTFVCINYSPWWSACKCPNRSSWCPGASGYPTTTTLPPCKISWATRRHILEYVFISSYNYSSTRLLQLLRSIRHICRCFKKLHFYERSLTTKLHISDIIRRCSTDFLQFK